ncbi:MAG: hypothetical protein LC645_06175 [Geobacteraceae bacterium]|nr:hypothetical protein [Geobacteraceae bacterium]
MNIRTLAFSCSLALSLVAVTTSVTAQNAENGNKGISSVEERRLLAEFKENRQQLNERNQELQKRELELNILQDEVDKKLEQLEQLRLQLEEMLADKDVQEQERIRHAVPAQYSRTWKARRRHASVKLTQPSKKTEET